MARKVGTSTAPKAAGNRGKGRPKGSPNKTTVAVKEALLRAFDGIGGVDTLVEWASLNQTEFYKLYARLLPTEITGKDGGAIETRDLPPAEREARVFSLLTAAKARKKG